MTAKPQTLVFHPDVFEMRWPAIRIDSPHPEKAHELADDAARVRLLNGTATHEDRCIHCNVSVLALMEGEC